MKGESIESKVGALYMMRLSIAFIDLVSASSSEIIPVALPSPCKAFRGAESGS